MQSFVIRKAEIEDIPGIMSLVRELAIHVNHEDEFTAKAKDYEEAFESGMIKALVAIDPETNQCAGMCFGFLNFSTWKGKIMYLEDFVVSKEYRRSGLGQQLFDSFIAYSKTFDCKLLKWQLYEWNVVAHAFYVKNIAIFEGELLNARIYL